MRQGLRVSRRAALLGAAGGLLAGCESISGAFDSIFGERERPLPGERRPVLAAERPSGLDAAAARGGPIALPPIEENAEWPQAGGETDHSPGHPALARGLVEAWRSSIGTGSGSSKSPRILPFSTRTYRLRGSSARMKVGKIGSYHPGRVATK